ncbi:helix-turn-helix domain-containing protein [Streptococcus suis]|uniref:helix-turn-helix domain-containing protein n=1 Tax=Streptococcus suis TaxID=1307 RepID=UPI000CF4D72B|nr:helix-turn-helix domain-containing protein [Streptococcus suis]MCO8220649.1 helix-turn-helix domain-containing protein [Streptococcus suis]MEE3692604.1 helix-turn-helix domain-containing protein [Streptococcus suis]MEE3732996.1 helix-turn-helix domain-containing protein [Streptococcus suis]HEM3474024.1 helix-turn-helix transcriptional regulator [Streptococcus suis]HEM3511905.1 helix-turn-helix transcriptional regulator [Streptococcus suis]
MKKTADKNAFEKLLDESGLKRKVIAERLDISRSSLYKKQKNPRNIGADEMADFATVLGVDPKIVLNAILVS